MPAEHEAVLRIAATPAALDLIHDALRRFWDDVRIGEADRMRFELAVAEVAANIVEHCPGEVEMTLDLHAFGDRVEADFDENGSELPADIVEAAAEPDLMAEAGRGLVLARAALDEFTYARTDGHNHWHLVRCLHDD